MKASLVSFAKGFSVMLRPSVFRRTVLVAVLLFGGTLMRMERTLDTHRLSVEQRSDVLCARTLINGELLAKTGTTRLSHSNLSA